MTADILVKKETAFVLWRLANTSIAPKLIIGQLKPGTPLTFVNQREFLLQQHSLFSDLWMVDAAACGLSEGQVYHYWFEVSEANAQDDSARTLITDPMAYTVDWRLLAPRTSGSEVFEEDRYPAAVILFKDGKLLACDAGGEQSSLSDDNHFEQLPTNNRLVIYELPTTWTHAAVWGTQNVGIGSFCDVTALIDPNAGGLNFTDLHVTQKGRQYLVELGINSIELLPPADSFYDRGWGYGTTNFFAPDSDLGMGPNYSWPASNRDLQALIRTSHVNKIRVLIDSVTAFSRSNAYLKAAPNDFFIDPQAAPSDPDAHNSRQGKERKLRDGYGSSLFRYAHFVNSYDPVTGQEATMSTARQLMKASILYWINQFHVDGIRMDSVENVANWDFVQEYKDIARTAWADRFRDNANQEQIDARFLVVGEELHEPLDLLHQNRLDSLWHESFKRYVRHALIGQKVDDTSSFEETVRKMIDCRTFGYKDATEAIIYLTSHDVGDKNDMNMRLYNYLQKKGIQDAEKRIKLGFACLLTAVGVPMILAGEEFADQHDLFNAQGEVTHNDGKQIDPVNFARLEDDWRRRIKDYVSLLIKLRTSSNALAVNDTNFIHVDISEQKKVLAWVRGNAAEENVVVVVANFSDFGTDTSFGNSSEYVVNNWPATPTGKQWREVTQQREVPLDWIGKEPIFPWEAKVYEMF